eukprot:TRINITY_DN7479_c0_g1_i5.p1 TRINITY_DN7479_c0_g1~~TRINITY_DN7479_c0_g1_i5.p1  ORF type:complete len:471 (+),score=110.99 TRINITY_DN7479_c0_g1_i5:73-1485(+)
MCIRDSNNAEEHRELDCSGYEGDTGRTCRGSRNGDKRSRECSRVRVFSGIISRCARAVRKLIEILKSKKSKCVLLALDIIETCSKNGKELFHKKICTQEFMKVLLKQLKYVSFIFLLDQCRGKSKMFRSFVSVESKARRQTLENKILYLIQLWADAFMMHEDSYPFFLATYRQLRKERITFPPREASTRFMLSSLKLESPMFDHLEEISYKPNNNNSKPPVFNEAKAIAKAEKEFARFVGGRVELVSQDENLVSVVLSPSDIEVIRNYMQLADDVCVNAEELSSLKTDIALQVYRHIQAVHARCISIINAKVAHDVEYQLDTLLTLSEDLDVRVKLFQNTFIDLMVKAEAKAAGVSLEDIHRASVKEKEEGKEVVKRRKGPVKPLPPPPSNQFFQFQTKQSPLLDLLDDFDGREEKKEEPKEVKEVAKDLLDLQLDGEQVDGVTAETKEDTQGKPETENDFFEDLANRKA